MSKNLDQQKMQELLKILTEIMDEPYDSEEGLNPASLGKWCQQLKQIYADGFRHYYSEISAFLETFSLDAVQSLVDSLLGLLDYAEKCGVPDNVYKSIQKLYDHIDLESIRLDRMAIVKSISQEIEKKHKEINELSERTKEVAEKTQETIGDYHNQSIAILSIFSAVILAFMGGITFSAKALEAMGSVSLFRLVLTLLVLGLILANVIFILLCFVNMTVHKGKYGHGFNTLFLIFNIVVIGLIIVWLVIHFCGGGRVWETFDTVTTNLYR